MRQCPSCGAEGIPTYSVVVPLDRLPPGTKDLAHGDLLSECLCCKTWFRATGPGTLTAADKPQGPTVWISPPWKQTLTGSEWELSWDTMQVLFEREALVRAWVLPLFELLGQMRDAGFDTRLRAGQSLNSLGLSRSRAHGLQPKQSYLWLAPQLDGRVRMKGFIAGHACAHEPMPAQLSGPILEAVERLSDVEID